jgi:hypothetical protein
MKKPTSPELQQWLQDRRSEIDIDTIRKCAADLKADDPLGNERLLRSIQGAVTSLRAHVRRAKADSDAVG